MALKVNLYLLSTFNGRSRVQPSITPSRRLRVLVRNNECLIYGGGDTESGLLFLPQQDLMGAFRITQPAATESILNVHALNSFFQWFIPEMEDTLRASCPSKFK